MANLRLCGRFDAAPYGPDGQWLSRSREERLVPEASEDVSRRYWWGLTLRKPDAILLSLVRFVVLASAAVVQCTRAAGLERAEGEAADDTAYADDDHQGDDRQRHESNRRARDHRPTPLGCGAIPVERAAPAAEPDVLGGEGSGAGQTP